MRHTLGGGNQHIISSLIPSENVGISRLTFQHFFVVFQEKLCLEIAGGFEESMAQKVQEELEQVERRVFVFEKQENELRRVRILFRTEALFQYDRTDRPDHANRLK